MYEPMLGGASGAPHRRFGGQFDGWGRGPDRQVWVRMSQERPNQTGATCVKFVANRRRDGVDDVPQMSCVV